jgi:DNA-directed RNA polymerase subunit K/omega
MRVFTPNEITAGAANKYLAILIASKYARVLNEFPRVASGKEKKLTTRALEEITDPGIEYRVVPRKRPTE